MLTKEKFIKAMGYLNAYYIHFKLDIENEYVLAVWYEPFQTMDDTTFSNLVKSYSKSEVYPPSSPTSLLDFFRETMKLSDLSGEQAWELGYSKVKEHGFVVEDACKDLTNSGKTIVSKALFEMKTRFRYLMTDDLPFVRKDFISIYNRLLEGKASQLLNIDHQEMIKIGNGEE